MRSNEKTPKKEGISWWYPNSSVAETRKLSVSSMIQRESNFRMQVYIQVRCGKSSRRGCLEIKKGDNEIQDLANKGIFCYSLGIAKGKNNFLKIHLILI